MKRLLDKLIRRWYVPRSDFEKVHQGLFTARRLIIRHHDCTLPQITWGGFCPACHQVDGSEPEMDQIFEALEVRERL